MVFEELIGETIRKQRVEAEISAMSGNTFTLARNQIALANGVQDEFDILHFFLKDMFPKKYAAANKKWEKAKAKLERERPEAEAK